MNEDNVTPGFTFMILNKLPVSVDFLLNVHFYI